MKLAFKLAMKIWLNLKGYISKCVEFVDHRK